MDRMTQFLRGKGVYLVLTVCLLAAFLTGLVTLRMVARETMPELPASQQPKQEDKPVWEKDTNARPESGSVPPVTSRPSVSSSSSVSASAGASFWPTPSAASGSTPASSAARMPSYALPVAGSVLRAYSGDELVYNKTLGNWRTHNGVDYSCQAGAAVSAPCGGTVTKAQRDALWGTVVEITEADGTCWRVCGISGEAAVKEGDTVTVGQSLGSCGTISCESEDGAHIHLEVSRESGLCNPAELLAE